MKRMKMISILCFTGLLLLVSGCQSSEQSEEYAKTVFAMDTVMELKIYGNENVLDGAEQLIQKLEGDFSVTDSSSDISLLNQNKSGEVSADTWNLVQKAVDISERTQGNMDISVYPIVRAWGFTTDTPKIPEEQEIQELLKSVNYKEIDVSQENMIEISDNMEIDLGCIAKGYTGDKLINYFKKNGIENAMINLGGNVQVLGSKPDGSLWKVAIRNPDKTGYIGYVKVANQAVITSGGYERYFVEDGVIYHHIIDPATGYPAQGDIISVTIIGTEGYLCDALSTALFVMGKENAVSYWKINQDFEMILCTDNHEVYITQGLKDNFILSNDYKENQLKVISND